MKPGVSSQQSALSPQPSALGPLPYWHDARAATEARRIETNAERVRRLNRKLIVGGRDDVTLNCMRRGERVKHVWHRGSPVRLGLLLPISIDHWPDRGASIVASRRN
jgi:hypothetical protein